MFWKLNKASPEYSFPVIFTLGLSIWIIYIVDRLLDNKKIDNCPTERHIFHQRYTKILWYFVGLLVLLCTILLFYLPHSVIIFGVIICLITSIYLFVVSKISSKNNFQPYKEPITSLVYVSGVYGTTILHGPFTFSVLIGVIFFLIVFQNLLLFSLFELKKNTKAFNLAAYFGIKKSNSINLFITCFILVLSFILFHSSNITYQNRVVIVELSMSFCLLIINLFDSFFLINDRYRWVGDGIFLLPLVIIS